jgi:hypothetical protein
MRRYFIPSLAAAFLLSACGEAVDPDRNLAATEAEQNVADAVTGGTSAVRIGEFGPSFKACAAEGTTRNVGAGESLPVRAAPFANSAEAGSVPAGARFFICSRSLDQKWFGIVYDDAAAELAERCGVSDPVASPSTYEGPCRSGWVSSAFVKLIAGIQPPVPANQGPSTPTS